MTLTRLRLQLPGKLPGETLTYFLPTLGEHLHDSGLDWPDITTGFSCKLRAEYTRCFLNKGEGKGD